MSSDNDNVRLQIQKQMPGVSDFSYHIDDDPWLELYTALRSHLGMIETVISETVAYECKI